MWIVVNYGDEKKIAFEIEGDESLHDVMRVLHFVYHFPKKFSITFNNKPVPDVPGPLLDIDIIKNRPPEQSDLIELKVAIVSNGENKGPDGPVQQTEDISIGRYFKRDDKKSPSSINQSLSRKSNKSANVKLTPKA